MHRNRLGIEGGHARGVLEQAVTGGDAGIEGEADVEDVLGDGHEGGLARDDQARQGRGGGGGEDGGGGRDDGGGSRKKRS